MQHAFAAIDRAAPGKANVILRGEPGTGKQLLASALHMRSPRSTHAFIKLASSMVSDAQLADLAAGSTVFLDEVSELSASAQSALLALLLRPNADIRVIAATAKDLTQEVQAGRFHGELYECLAGVTVELPLLRDRKSDIPALAKFFLDRAAKDHRKRVDRVAPAALAAMLSYDWPGNVRELEHAIERAAAVATGPSIEAHHLPPTVRPAADSNCPPIPGSRLDELERYAILETLKLTNGSTSKAAEMLGISVRTIQYRMHEYNATPRAQLELVGKKLAI
jgi:DNA-binding NtrC family response regulator